MTLTRQERAALRAAVDERRRVQADVDATDCGDAATEGRYTQGCRCRSCRALATAARARRRRSPNVKVHNYSGYSNGCRCGECRRDHSAYNLVRRAAERAA